MAVSIETPRPTTSGFPVSDPAWIACTVPAATVPNDDRWTVRHTVSGNRSLISEVTCTAASSQAAITPSAIEVLVSPGTVATHGMSSSAGPNST